MPRQQGTSVQNSFIKGYITETTALAFPENACTATDNVVFDPFGRISRRLGLDTEASYSTASISYSDGKAITSFVWSAVAGNGNISFLVVQHAQFLNFYNVSDTAEVSGNIHATSIDLNTFLASESDKDPSNFECQYAAGNGNLFVTNPACDPFYVVYDVASNTFTPASISLSQRDFEGLEDTLAIDFRPTDDVATATNANHVYNLINQGWGLTDALTQWDVARADLPSNADYAELYRGSATDSFDNAHVTANDPGNRPAPTGHFILEVAKQNRQEVFEAEGYVAATTSDTFSLVDTATGTIFTNKDTLTSKAFNGVTLAGSGETAFNSVNATSSYIGKNFGTSPKSISRVIYWPSTDVGYVNPSAGRYPITLTLYGKNSLPASGTDGTVLGTAVIAAIDFDPTSIDSNDIGTTYQYVWVNATTGGAAAKFDVAELQIFSSSISFERPSCIEFYTGRLFYGGISTSAIANNIYFTQIIEGTDQYGQCYQKNDPTSTIPDLLPDDGGVIKIPDMGTLHRMYAYQNALLCLASNGIWLVSGSAGSNFKATDYVVKKISSIGMDSPQSLLSIKGLPSWWGEDGIYTVQFDPNYDSFTPTSISLGTIDTFYRAIPLENRKYVQGIYDEDKQVGYWLYHTTTLGTDIYKYDSILAIDARSKAFYTWSLSSGPIIRGFDFIKPASRTNLPKVKFIVHRNYNGSTAGQTFGEILSTTYKDWSVEGSNTDYTSEFTTGYKLDGQTQKFFQTPYIFIFLEQETDASAYVQAIFDFTTSSSEGKWSTKQQVYNSGLLNRAANFRRLKVRGKGRALQLHFNSESSKPFTIIGWSILESVGTTL